mgnify:CR=1 FL=1
MLNNQWLNKHKPKPQSFLPDGLAFHIHSWFGTPCKPWIFRTWNDNIRITTLLKINLVHMTHLLLTCWKPLSHSSLIGYTVWWWSLQEHLCIVQTLKFTSGRNWTLRALYTECHCVGSGVQGSNHDLYVVLLIISFEEGWWGNLRITKPPQFLAQMKKLWFFFSKN